MNTRRMHRLNKLIATAGLLIVTSLAHAQKSMDVQIEPLGMTPNSQSSIQQELFYFNRTDLLSFVDQQNPDGTASFNLNFNFHNKRQWQMVLFPSKVLAADYSTVNKNAPTYNLATNITYQGYLKNKPGATVRMTISEHLIHAVVSDNDETFILESNGTSQRDTLTLNKSSDLLTELECGTPEHQGKRHTVDEFLRETFAKKSAQESKIDNTATAPLRVAKLAIVCDVQCLNKQSGNKAAVNADAQTIVNIVNGYYAEYDVSYELQPLVFIETASNPWTDYPADEAKHTNSFAGWASSNIAVEHNVGMLFTGVNQNGINYAFLSHMCPGDNYRYGMHDYNYSQSLQQRGNLVTHELGHLWGANHVSPADSSYIMNASVFGGTLAWKESTRAVISDAVVSFSGCLDDGGPADPYCAVVTGTAAAGTDFISSVTVNNTIVKQDDIRIVPRADYTETIINMDKSTSTSLTITPSNSFDLSVIGVWIDWNQDNDFADANEFIASQKGSGPYLFNITPPADVNVSRTRLRIRLGYDGNNELGSNGELVQACGQFEFDGGETEDYTVNITDGVNQNPLAIVANSNLSVNEGNSVTLDASGSSDPDGDSISFAWTQTNGNNVTLTNSNSSRASFTSPEVAATTTLTFEVTVTDSNGATDTSSITVTVLNIETDTSKESSGGGVFDWVLMTLLLLGRQIRKARLNNLC